MDPFGTHFHNCLAVAVSPSTTVDAVTVRAASRSRVKASPQQRSCSSLSPPAASSTPTSHPWRCLAADPETSAAALVVMAVWAASSAEATAPLAVPRSGWYAKNWNAERDPTFFGRLGFSGRQETLLESSIFFIVNRARVAFFVK